MPLAIQSKFALLLIAFALCMGCGQEHSVLASVKQKWQEVSLIGEPVS
jgi:hypothetical protein